VPNLAPISSLSTGIRFTRAGFYAQPNLSRSYGVIKLPNGREGIALGGWEWDITLTTEWSTTLPVKDVQVALFEQNSHGEMQDATNKFLGSNVVHGNNSVVISDFNRDGKPDVFFPAFNETPHRGMPSTLFASNAAGTFDRIVSDDAVMAHDAQVFVYQGEPTVFTGGFGYNPVYRFLNGKMSLIGELNNVATVMSHAVTDFVGRGDIQVVGGSPDTNGGGVFIYSLASSMDRNLTNTPLASIPTYFSTRPAYQNYSSFFGRGVTHSYRLWVDDFNHDGLPDVVAGQSMWGDDVNFPSMLQLNQNAGNLNFVDKTDALNPEFIAEGDEIDYSMQMRDIDQSGIKSYLLSTPHPFWGGGSLSRQRNYLLLNDGTGRLHVALHEEFVDLTRQIMQVISPEGDLYGDHAGLHWNGAGQWVPNVLEDFGIPSFMAYLTEGGAINYLAKIDVTHPHATLVNVPLGYRPQVDFRKPISITDRNHSQKIRTFAGDDVIYELNAASQTTIDGGAGSDTVVYTGRMQDYTIRYSGLTVQVEKNSGSQIDTLTNIEKIQFSDAIEETGYILTVHSGRYGVVTISQGDTVCSGVCQVKLRLGAQVSMTATPGSGANFYGWTGPCKGQGTTCILSMDRIQDVTAIFDTPQSRRAKLVLPAIIS